jgi:hypothetical protein
MEVIQRVAAPAL